MIIEDKLSNVTTLSAVLTPIRTMKAYALNVARKRFFNIAENILMIVSLGSMSWMGPQMIEPNMYSLWLFSLPSSPHTDRGSHASSCSLRVAFFVPLVF